METTTKIKAKTKHTYHQFVSYKTADGTEVKVTTQLYKIGVYIIINNDSRSQCCTSPSGMVKAERHTKKLYDKGDITDLVLSGKITVQEDDNGLWKQIN